MHVSFDNIQSTVDPVELHDDRSVERLRVPHALAVRHGEATGGKVIKPATNVTADGNLDQRIREIRGSLGPMSGLYSMMGGSTVAFRINGNSWSKLARG
jgi:hypothetical protein